MNPLQDQVAQFLSERGLVARAKTMDQYRGVLTMIFMPWVIEAGISDPAQVTDRRMTEFTEWLRQRPRKLSQSSLRTYVRVVRLFLNWAEVAVGRYRAPAKPRTFRDTLTLDEIDRLERAAGKNERNRLLVRVLADTGIRVGELVGLKGTDLRSQGSRCFVRVDGKTGPRLTAVPVDTFARLKVLARDDPDQHIFTSHQGGGSLTPSAVRQVVHYLAKEAGISKRTYPHLLRHSFATNLLIRNVNPILVQKAMGHSSLAMISETYAHILPENSYDILMAALR